MTKLQDELRAAIISYFHGQKGDGEEFIKDSRWQKLESLITRAVDIKALELCNELGGEIPTRIEYWIELAEAQND